MFWKGRKGLAIALAVAALALPAAPAAAAGPGERGALSAPRLDLWAALGRLGGWLRTTFLSDGSSYIDPNGLQAGPGEGSTSDGSPFIDPNGLVADGSSHIDPNG